MLGASRPMMRFETLLIVVAEEDWMGVAGVDSLVAEELLELLFPKPNFHFEGFFVIAGGAATGAGGRAAATVTGVGGALNVPVTDAVRGDETLPDLDVRLSSLARAWLALARTSRV